MEERRKFSPIEFYKYVTEPIPKKDLDLWLKANNIISEKSELFFYFIKSLYLLVDKTYLGSDVIKDEDDVVNHFKWCWNKTIDNLEKEGILFQREGPHYDYFWNFFLESFYGDKFDSVINRVDKFFSTLFKISDRKTKSELDIYTELYKTLDNNLIK
tara:strand:- start:73 stop:543 length:471 start_codon:yes stop_codon:yes gene_type:complete